MVVFMTFTKKTVTMLYIYTYRPCDRRERVERAALPTLCTPQVKSKGVLC